MFWTLAIAAVIAAVAALLARREIGLYRLRRDAEDDLFVYSKWRLARRLTGVFVLALTACTLVAWELFPPTTATGASVFMTVFLTEVAALVILPIFDLVDTTRSARVGNLPPGVSEALEQRQDNLDKSSGGPLERKRLRQVGVDKNAIDRVALGRQPRLRVAVKRAPEASVPALRRGDRQRS